MSSFSNLGKFANILLGNIRILFLETFNTSKFTKSVRKEGMDDKSFLQRSRNFNCFKEARV